MKHNSLDSIYGDVFLGVPMEDGQTWPRFDAMLRNGQELTWVPEAYERAMQLFDTGRPESAERIDEVISVVCRMPYDHTARVERLRALLSAAPA